jgi:hypothetical protein
MAFEIEVVDTAHENIVVLQHSAQTGRLHPAWYVLHPMTEGEHTVLAYRSKRFHKPGLALLDEAVEVAHQLAFSVGATVTGNFPVVEVDKAGVGHIYREGDS